MADEMATGLTTRFWAKVRKADGDACWLWTGACDTNGYGVIRAHDRQVNTHRVSWAFHFGPIPDGLHVLHHCDRRACVRPDHLFIGTHRDNMIDMIRKGRSASHNKRSPMPVRDDQVQVSVRVPLELHQRIRDHAVARRQLICEFTRDAIAELLAREQAAADAAPSTDESAA